MNLPAERIFTVNDAGYALIRNAISDFPVFDYQAIKRPFGLVQTVTNKLPIISSVAVTRGTGNVLNGNYFYADVERDHEGISEIRWYAAETDTDSAYKEISGATAKTFTYDDTYAGQYIKMEVTPVDIFGNKGTAVRSSAVLIAKDIDAFVQQIADAQSKLDAATEGSDLGQYPSEAIDALKQAIADATEASKGEEIETPEGLTKAVEALNQAVNAFNSARVKALTDSVGSGEISIPADLEDITITLPNVTGTYTLKGSVLPKGAVITAIINGKQITIEVPEAVTLPSGEFNISALENSSAADAGDVVLACSLGNAEDAYSPALNVTVDGVSGYRISYVQDGQLVEISDLTTEEQSQ